MVILKEPTIFPEKIAGIPENYNFEIAKTLKTIEKLNAKKVTLQFPDGLLCYAPLLIDTIQKYTNADCVVLDDVVYGACCIDDQSIESDLLIHYGHSCLIPITEMLTRVLYVFVDIRIDIDHLYELIVGTFTGKVAIIGTIQFNSSVNKLKRVLNSRQRERHEKCMIHGIEALEEATFLKSTQNTNLSSRKNDPECTCVQSIVPQVKPLSPGEVLGCTSPSINGVENVIYIGDGRFHLESAMIKNPHLNYYKYCPFSRKLTQEFYDFDKMRSIRENEIRRAFDGKSFGVILGSLGRQGNKRIFENVIKKLESYGKYTIFRIVVDEINQRILDNYDFIDAFVQISCPRLSIDWGSCYSKPLLSPFEVFYSGDYQMDYYSNEGNAPWKNYNNAYQ